MACLEPIRVPVDDLHDRNYCNACSHPLKQKRSPIHTSGVDGDHDAWRPGKDNDCLTLIEGRGWI